MYTVGTEIESIPEAESEAEPEPKSVEDLVWKPGDTYVQADRVVQTEDGRYFAVSQSQLDGLLERGCLEVRQVN